uniref:LisH domain-containing protein n=1 Tax=Plectus sambesii TaxID=2011161 RepID=A0A914UWD6_9BILA
MANPFESEKSFHRLSDHLMEEKGTDDDGERRSEGSGASVPLEAPASFVIGGLNEESPERSLSQPDSKLYNPSSTSDIQNSTRISMDAIAKRLLSENLILSALELHTELTESGREVKRLRDYFSNPANFEPQTSTGGGLQRTNSVQTFDSFDMNGSDLGDVQGDDKMAVLEFELRKAREVIQNLRKQLTTASELSQVNPAQTHEASSFEPTEALVSSAMTDSCYMPSAILPHEQRAINFLAHEYLLQQNYKLTSVTFSDEVADQAPYVCQCASHALRQFNSRLEPEGHVFFGASVQRSAKSTEAIFLLAQEAFTLGNRRLEWTCNNKNPRSN